MWPILLIGLIGAPLDDTRGAADRVILRDGSTVLGQVLEPDPRGKLTMIVRRDWAEANLPDRALAWQATEAPWVERARAERRTRLDAWRLERGAPAPGRPADSLANWLEAEVDRLADNVPAPRAPLLVVVLDRKEVERVERQGAEATRRLRQGWRAGFDDVETMPLDDLEAGLLVRGFPLGDNGPVPVDDLLPLPTESDDRWLARRAATEVAHEPGLRFLRFQGMVLPEGQPGASISPAGLLPGLMRDLLGEAPLEDPIVPHLRRIEAKGRVGATLTSLEFSPDLSGAEVEVTLLARFGPEHWVPVVHRRSTVRLDDLPDGAAGPLQADPQVQAALRLVEGLGLGGVDPEMTRRALNMGAATQRALDQARTALQPELDALALPVGAARPGP